MLPVRRRGFKAWRPFAPLFVVVTDLLHTKKFDYAVTIKAYRFLLEITPATITAEPYPYYGPFYGCLGMHLLGQEYQADKGFRENTRGYLAAVHKQLVAWQEKSGAWPLRGWMPSSLEDADYPTAFATMTLFVTEGRLSVYNRKPPKLPDRPGDEEKRTGKE